MSWLPVQQPPQKRGNKLFVSSPSFLLYRSLALPSSPGTPGSMSAHPFSVQSRSRLYEAILCRAPLRKMAERVLGLTGLARQDQPDT